MRPPPDGTVDKVDWPAVSWYYVGFDYTGDPFTPTVRAGWFSFHNALHEQEFIDLMRGEADDSAIWAYWAAGVDLLSNPVPKLTGNLELNYNHFIIEANTDSVWCRWALGTQPGNRGNAEINLQTGEQVNFV